MKKRSGKLGRPSPETGPKTNGVILKKKPDGLADCDKVITPACLEALYNISYTPTETSKNSYGIVEFTPQAYVASDLDLFFKNFTPSLVGNRPTLVSIDGGVVQTTNKSFDLNGESNLDLQYAMALVTSQKISLLQTGDTVEGAGFDNWLDAVDASYCTFEGGDDPSQDGIYPDTQPGGYKGKESCGIIKPPYVVSTSYGQDEATVTAKFAQRQCTEYAKLGMMGTSVLYSSGDSGVAGSGGACLSKTGKESSKGKRFNPSFPASCSYVTAVGATQIQNGSSVTEPEVACNQVIYSGGGWSDIFAMPSYQSKAVKGYLKNSPPPYTAAQYNNTGVSRAFPDISANGANYAVALDGQFELVYGTSASSPVVGSIITLINDARLAKGKAALGFLNPSIYSSNFTSGFNDITEGTNPGCGTKGFSTAKGWDPVTGMGTPNTAKLMDLFLALP